ncbi:MULTISPECIES: TM2 domain-containing protein [unclassified Dysgonomonas]|uniref:TM2 domain-containing protein n=1 Tax=unclassified Dysgonomonas TaxID=2630389 RepID=UPI001C88A691|nr:MULTISPECIES: TM2 domain-containing protein [unclassified Dysgonomonas]
MEYSEPKASIDQARVNLFLATNGKKFSPYQLNQIIAELPNLTDAQFQALLSQDFKDPTMMLIISLLGGLLGIDRFILNDTGLGVLKLLTCGGFYIWMIIDWFIIQDRTKEYNYNLLVQTVNRIK